MPSFKILFDSLRPSTLVCSQDLYAAERFPQRVRKAPGGCENWGSLRDEGLGETVQRGVPQQQSDPGEGCRPFPARLRGCLELHKLTKM